MARMLNASIVAKFVGTGEGNRPVFFPREDLYSMGGP
jgi:hypothetical protein